MYVITFRGVLLKREICLAWLETMRRDNETCSEHARLWVTKQSTARQLGVCVCVCEKTTIIIGHPIYSWPIYKGSL